MIKSRSPLAALLAVLTVVIGAAAFGTLRAHAATPVQRFRVTNDAHRVVECELLVDSHIRTYLKVHMGKTYGDDFTQGRRLQLACIRGAQDLFGPLKLGVDYHFVDAPGDRIDVVAAPAGG